MGGSLQCPRIKLFVWIITLGNTTDQRLLTEDKSRTKMSGSNRTINIRRPRPEYMGTGVPPPPPYGVYQQWRIQPCTPQERRRDPGRSDNTRGKISSEARSDPPPYSHRLAVLTEGEKLGSAATRCPTIGVSRDGSREPLHGDSPPNKVVWERGGQLAWEGGGDWGRRPMEAPLD